MVGSLLGYSEPAAAKPYPIMVEAKDTKKMIDKAGARLANADDRQHVEEMLKVVLKKLPGIKPSNLELAHNACKALFELPEYCKDVPTTREAKDILISLIKKGASFHEALNTLDPMLKDLLTDQDQYDLDPKLGSELNEMPRLNWKEFDKLKYSITVIVNYADNLQEYIEIEKMAPNRPRRAFIRIMATAYEICRGRPAKDDFHSNNDYSRFSGDFFELVWDCLSASGANLQSKRSVYDDIKMTLKNRKPRTGLDVATNQKQ